MGEEEFVNILVPKGRVLDVYRYLARVAHAGRD